MAFEHKDNSGALFKNDKKTSDTHADYTGDGVIDGVSMWINAWINDKKGGGKYMKLTFRPKNPPLEKPAPNVAVTHDDPRTQRGRIVDLDDSVPFSPEFR
jgi:hypothetical protein